MRIPFILNNNDLITNSISGINADLYLLPEDVYGSGNPDNKCYNDNDYVAQQGLQNISPCQYGEYFN